ncbi:hypothetical protein B296_00022025, partial [Ensete ventricosum]
ISHLSQANSTLQAQVEQPKEERKAVEAQVVVLSSKLARACLQAEKVEQRLPEAQREVDSQAFELALELGLALRRTKETEAQVEEAQDELTMAEDMATKSITKGEQQIEALHRKLKDAR